MKDLIKNIKTLKKDIKAESIIVDLLKNNIISDNQYLVSNEGQFKRSFRYDVLDASVIDFHYDSLQILLLELSRDSFYDVLPQVMTHSPNSDTPGKGSITMVEEYKTRKKQEKSAREFFSPFENEFFQFRVKTEYLERNLFEEIDHDQDSQLFFDFWKLPKDLPTCLMSKFVRFLPFAHRIVGDISMATKILSMILEEKVNVSDYDSVKYGDEGQDVMLGDFALGVDSVLGNVYEDYSKHLLLEIGPLVQTDFKEFLKGKSYDKFVSLFCDYFFPIEVEIQVRLSLLKEEQVFDLKEQLILGYNTYLDE